MESEEDIFARFSDLNPVKELPVQRPRNVGIRAAKTSGRKVQRSNGLRRYVGIAAGLVLIGIATAYIAQTFSDDEQVSASSESETTAVSEVAPEASTVTPREQPVPNSLVPTPAHAVDANDVPRLVLNDPPEEWGEGLVDPDHDLAAWEQAETKAFYRSDDGLEFYVSSGYFPFAGFSEAVLIDGPLGSGDLEITTGPLTSADGNEIPVVQLGNLHGISTSLEVAEIAEALVEIERSDSSVLPSDLAFGLKKTAVLSSYIQEYDDRADETSSVISPPSELIGRNRIQNVTPWGSSTSYTGENLNFLHATSFDSAKFLYLEATFLAEFEEADLKVVAATEDSLVYEKDDLLWVILLDTSEPALGRVLSIEGGGTTPSEALDLVRNSSLATE